MQVVTLQGSRDVDPAGDPYGFIQTPLAQHTPSYPLLVTTQMSRDRSVDQLILMSDGRYLSSTTSSMMLRIVTYNADAESWAYVWFPFEWQDAGAIVAGLTSCLCLCWLTHPTHLAGRLSVHLLLCCTVDVHKMVTALHVVQLMPSQAANSGTVMSVRNKHSRQE